MGLTIEAIPFKFNFPDDWLPFCALTGRGNQYSQVIEHFRSGKLFQLGSRPYHRQKEFRAGSLGISPIWPEAAAAIFRSGAPPLTDGGRARELSLLLADLDETEALMEKAPQEIREAALFGSYHDRSG